MVETGADLQEYALLDAQHFGVPQRRRRVFLISVFDPATASRCPDPLLPVGESLRGDSKKGKQKGQTTPGKAATGFGRGSFGGWTETNTAIALSARDFKGGTTVAVESFTGTSHAQYGEGVGTIRANGGDLGGGSETLLVEPFVKSRRPQSNTDDETWVPGEVNPTLNSFDVGDTRATTAIVEPMLLDGRRVDDVRIYEPPVQTLQARMGTGGNNVPLLAFDTQFGSNANVFENHSPTLKASQQSPSIAIPIQDGREIEKHQNGLGVGDDGDPSYTIDRTGSQSVAYPIQGKGYGTENDPMFTLNLADRHAVALPMAVRRLTPLECERLMGWPDDHTRYKADGTEQADTHRYKQCGNGVASPVAQWIAQHMRRINEIQ
jgi:DNA (cytosine-5)-methyltransferase 1